MRKLVRLFLGLLVVFIPIPLGGNRPWIVLTCLAAASLVAGVAALSCVPRARFPRRAVQLAVLLGIGGAWLLFVTLQFAGGIELIGGLAAPGPTIAREAISALQETSRFAPISLFPDATLHEIAYGLLCFIVFALAAWAVRVPGHAYWLLGFVGVSVALQCAIGAWEYFLRVDFPSMTPLLDRPINGTFVNRNHFAGFIATGAGLAIGLIAHELFGRDDGRDPTLGGLALRILDLVSGRYIVVAGTLILVATVIGASGSRGAFLGIIVAIVAGFGVMAVHSAASGRKAAALGLGTLVLVGAAMSNSTMMDRFTRLVERGLEDGRIAEWSISLDTIASRPITGFGGGTFADAYALHRDGRLQRNQSFDHAHNQYLEMLVEYGIAGTALLAVFVLMALRMAAVSPGLATDPGVGTVATGVLFAMLTLLGHALVEFTFEIPAILVVFFLLAGIAAAAFTWMGPAQVRRRDVREASDVGTVTRGRRRRRGAA